MEEDWFEFYGSINILGNSVTSTVTIPGTTEGITLSPPPMTMTYTPDWLMDTSTTFMICYDSITGQVKLSCYVKSLVVWFTNTPYTPRSDNLNFMWGVFRKNIH